MIQALFFDAAGTLITPAEPVALTYTRILGKFGHRLEPGLLGASFAQAFKEAGLPDYPAFPSGDLAERAWWRRVVHSTIKPHSPLPLDEEAFQALFQHYAGGNAWRIYPEVRSVLDQVRANGQRLAVVSNFDLRLHSILADHDLTSSFDLIVTSAEARARKPDPSIFLQAATALGISPAQTIHAGDSANADIRGAQRAGIPSYLVQRPQRDLLGFLDFIDQSRGK